MAHRLLLFLGAAPLLAEAWMNGAGRAVGVRRSAATEGRALSLSLAWHGTLARLLWNTKYWRGSQSVPVGYATEKSTMWLLVVCRRQ